MTGEEDGRRTRVGTADEGCESVGQNFPRFWNILSFLPCFPVETQISLKQGNFPASGSPGFGRHVHSED